MIEAEGTLECGEEDREGRVQCRDKSFLRKIRTQELSDGSRRVRYSASQTPSHLWSALGTGDCLKNYREMGNMHVSSGLEVQCGKEDKE